METPARGGGCAECPLIDSSGEVLAAQLCQQQQGGSARKPYPLWLFAAASLPGKRPHAPLSLVDGASNLRRETGRRLGRQAARARAAEMGVLLPCTWERSCEGEPWPLAFPALAEATRPSRQVAEAPGHLKGNGCLELGLRPLRLESLDFAQSALSLSKILSLPLRGARAAVALRRAKLSALWVRGLYKCWEV